MRGQILLNLLKSINEFSGDVSDHVLAVITAGYGASVSKLEWEARKHKRNRERSSAAYEEERKLRHKYHVMIHKLKSDGLIQERIKNGQTHLNLTGIGSVKLRNLQSALEERIRIPAYDRPVGKVIIIVSFDIPEEYRRKRAWLRSVLKNLGMRMIHQSTWFGKGKLPKRFLDDLYKMRLTNFIEIFEVTKSGTLTHVF